MPRKCEAHIRTSVLMVMIAIELCRSWRADCNLALLLLMVVVVVVMEARQRGRLTKVQRRPCAHDAAQSDLWRLVLLHWPTTTCDCIGPIALGSSCNGRHTSHELVLGRQH